MKPTAAIKSFPAPVRGWIENENLANNRGMGASVLENGFPLTDTVRVRQGALLAGVVGERLYTLITYSAGGAESLFAASATALYDISTFPSSAPTAKTLAGLSSGRWSYTQFTPDTTPYLVMANGFDPVMAYDGSDWFPVTATAVKSLAYDVMTAGFTIGETVTGGSSAAHGVVRAIEIITATTGILSLDTVTGTFTDNEALAGSSGGAAQANGASATLSSATITGVTSSNLSHVWHYGSRLWFVEKDTTTAWYLPVDQFGGAAADFALGASFKLGGSLLFGATWSADSGDGMDDRIVFVSTEGEIAVFQGADPEATDWQLVGIYSVGKPVSTETMRAGGDLLIATTDGIVPLSAIITKDPAALGVAAVSYPIQPAWLRVQKSNSDNTPVRMLKWQKLSMAIIAYPHRTGNLKETHVVNLTTGAWAKWTGLDIQCMALFRDNAFYADTEGNLFEFESGGTDNEMPYVFRVQLLPDHFGVPAAYKQVQQGRATFRFLKNFDALLSAATNYSTTFPTAPNSYPDVDSPAVWDVGLWDVAIWDDGDDNEARVTATSYWQSIGASGFSVSPQVQITCGGTRKADAELVSMDFSYQVGETVI